MYNTFTSEYKGEECIDPTRSSKDNVENVTNEEYLGEPKMNSVDPEYTEDGSNSVPGDLFISSLRDKNILQGITPTLVISI